MTGVDGLVSNDLPFSGGGTLILGLDPEADLSTLQAAGEHAMAFAPGAGAKADGIIIDLTAAPVDRGDYLSRPDDARYAAMIDLTFDEDADSSIQLLRAISTMPGVVQYRDLNGKRHSGKKAQHFLIVEDAATACMTLKAVRVLEGDRADPIDTVYVGDRLAVPCDGLSGLGWLDADAYAEAVAVREFMA